MGKVYLLNKHDFNYAEKLRNELTLKDILTTDEVKDFIDLQTECSLEISEPIHILQESGLTIKNALRPEGLVFCLAMDEKKCIGYGYGYIDEDDKETFYLDSIGVSSLHRGNKIGTEIKVKLIRHAFENSEIKRIKAITQPDNEKTIHINKKLGFKDHTIQPL
jgi:ribosomal protein S18 acetylase RimI-like enzyme